MASRISFDKRVALPPRTKHQLPHSYDRIAKSMSARKRGRPRKPSPMADDDDDDEKAYTDDEEGVDSVLERDDAADPVSGEEDKESTITIARLDPASAPETKQMESTETATRQCIDVYQAEGPAESRKKLVVRRSVRKVSKSSSKEIHRRVQRGGRSRDQALENGNEERVSKAMVVKEAGGRKRMRKGKPCRAAEACLCVKTEDS